MGRAGRPGRGRRWTGRETRRLYETRVQLDRAGDCPGGVTMKRLAAIAGVPLRRAKVIVALLQSVGLATRQPRVRRSRALSGPQEMDAVLDEYERRGSDDRQRLADMMHYAQSTECRVRLLRRYFGEEPGPEHCGHCDNCRAGISRDVPLGETSTTVLPG